MPKLDIDIRDVIGLFGLEYSPRNPAGNGSKFWVRCPFCGSGNGKPEYKMNINVSLGAYRCVKCAPDGSGGTLDLYARLKHGTRHIKGPNGNGRELEAELRDDLHLGPASYTAKPSAHQSNEATYSAELERADDASVSATYEKLLSLPCFALTEQHKSALIKRGLSEEAIVNNGYRSFTMAAARTLITDKVKEVYTKEKLGAVKANPMFSYILGRYSDERLMAGIAIANTMLRAKCRMDGVPGFFKLRNRWCFLFNPGMVVPTRNVYGQIVALQLRKDSGNLRYLTVSASGLPRGVTRNISRAHFPVWNAPIGPDTKVFFTEGPLKADIALDMIQKDYGRNDVAFIAIHGVNNTADLPGIFAELKAHGVTTVFNALDMDKVTNINVARGSQNIRHLLDEAGLATKTLFWDDGAAADKMVELQHLCEVNGISVPGGKNIYTRLARTTSALDARGVPISRQTKEWAKSSKGIDDMLLTLRSK